MNEKFYRASNDHCFKCIFLDERNKDLLIELLESVLEEKILNVTYLRDELNKDNVFLKQGVLDCWLDTPNGKIGIELNSSEQKNYRVKSSSYIFDMYSHYFKVGEMYNENIRFIQINLTYHDAKSDKFKTEYYLQNNEELKFISNMKIIEINMDNVEKLWYDDSRKGVKKYGILTCLNRDLNELKEIDKNTSLNKFMEELDRVNKDPKFRLFMTSEEANALLNRGNVIDARNEGIELGEKKSVMSMFENGMTKEEIAKVLKLDIKKIEEYLK